MQDSTKHAVSLGPVQETLLIPLYGRALESRKADGILTDVKSEEIVAGIDYDFGKFSDADSQRSFTRTTLRTAIIDRILRRFLQEHPEATVVEIGCGLNTRFERVDNGDISWYDLDVPDVASLWHQFFEEGGRRKFLAYSAFDEAWMKQVQAESHGPFIFISEASVIYFPEEEVKIYMQNLGRFFPGSHYIFDSATSAFLKHLKQHDALKYCRSYFQWTLDDEAEIEGWLPGTAWIRRFDLELANKEFEHLYPEHLKRSLRWQSLWGKNSAKGYFLNMIQLPE
jgi:O-methyltransferase involved in polyketide biosynthesis